ncbi:MAG: hypothetical protein HY814_13400 [Candidatus Riflebacteria bacterium]|nr:hypothetical protein [Candidatus Riflebacteria bacterium]
MLAKTFRTAHWTVAAVTAGLLLLAASEAGAAGWVWSRWDYPNDLDETVWLTPTSTLTATAIDVRFDPVTELESGADFLEIAAQNGVPVAGSPFTGLALAGRTVRVPGPAARLRLRTDGSNPPGRAYGAGVLGIDPVEPPSQVVVQGQGALPAGRVGAIYRYQLQADGVPPFEWSIVSTQSTSPVPGLTLTPSGLLVGIPHAAGDYAFDVLAESQAQRAGSGRFTLQVKPQFRPRLVRRVGVLSNQVVPVTLETQDLDVPLREALAILAYDPDLLAYLSAQKGAAASSCQLYPARVGLGALALVFVGAIAPPGGDLAVTQFAVSGSPSQADLEDAVYTTLVRMETREGEVLYVLPPTADPGFDQTVALTPAKRLSVIDPTADFRLTAAARRKPWITLDGSRSVDSRGRPLQYRWTQLVDPPPPRTVQLSSQGREAVVTFVTDVPGEYRFALRVTNGEGSSVPAETRVRVVEANSRPPVAHIDVKVGLPPTVGLADPTAGSLVVRANSMVTFDAGRSSDPDLGDRDALLYAWEPPRGANLTSTTLKSTSFLAATTGTYEVGLVVTDRTGLSSPRAAARFVVVPQSQPALQVAVRAAATDTGVTTQGFADGLLRTRAPSLHASLTAGTVTTVALKAEVSGTESTVPTTYRWQRLSGPELELDDERRAVATARPTTPGVYDFELTVFLGSSEDPTAITTRARVRLVVESDKVKVPRASASVTRPVRGKREPLAANGSGASVAGAGSRFELNGSASMALTTGTSIRTYRWVQESGPPVDLSEADSPVATVFAPDLRDEQPHELLFSLYVDDGQVRSEPVPVAVEVLPPATTAHETVELTTGFGLWNFTVDPRPGDGTTVSAAHVDATWNPAFVIGREVTSAGTQRFVGHVPELATPGFPLRPGFAYLTRQAAGTTRSVEVTGRPWSEAARQVPLARGVNFVGLFDTTPAHWTGSDLRERCGATFVARPVAGPGGSLTFDTYLGFQGQQAFPVQKGRGYIVGMPASRIVSLP